MNAARAGVTKYLSESQCELDHVQRQIIRTDANQGDGHVWPEIENRICWRSGSGSVMGKAGVEFG